MVYETGLILPLLWLVQALGQIFLWISWIQVKEYRFDRLAVFLRSREGKSALDLTVIFVKLLVLLLATFLSRVRVLEILYLWLAARFLNKVVRKSARRPILTVRAGVIFGFCLLMILLASISIYQANVGEVIPTLLIAELELLVLPIIGVLLTAPVVWLVERREMKMAGSKLADVNPIVIGISGSFGKTTSKEFLRQLLETEYKVLATGGSINTPLGISRIINKSITKRTQIFIAEIGAYRIGEIRKICGFIRPSIALLTGIEPQHLGLFGSVENIKRAKFELVESLPSEGKAVFNNSTEQVNKLAMQARRLENKLKVSTYKLVKAKTDWSSDLESRVVSASVDGIEFEVKKDGSKRAFFAPLLGEQLVANLSGAILIARMLGVSWSKIRLRCQKLEMPKHTMRVGYLPGGAVVIDDSRNATPGGFELALDFLHLYKGKKRFVITPGIIELGELSTKVHINLGKKMQVFVEKIILTSEEFAESLRRGLGKRKDKVSVVVDPRKIRQEFRDLDSQGNVILLEGRVPKAIINALSQKK